MLKWNNKRGIPILSTKHLFNETIHTYLFDAIFLKQISDSIELFNPICELINVSQKSTSSIADAAEAWLDLPNKISNDKGFESLIKKR